MRLRASLVIIAIATIAPVLISAQERYTVQRGDNLSRIGIKYGVPYRAIMAANNLHHTHIYEGQTLLIPSKEEAIQRPVIPPVETVINEPPMPFDRYRSPAVAKQEVIPPPPIAIVGMPSGEKPIDPLPAPAPVTTETAAVYVKPIQKAIPVPARSSTPVQAGRVSKPVLPTYNGVSPYNNSILPEQTVVASKSPVAAPAKTPAKSTVKKISRGRTVAISSNKGTYIVQPGDSVRSISKEHGISFFELRSANNIMFKRIYPGQILKIPGGGRQSRSMNISPY